MSTQTIARYGRRSAARWSDLPDDLLGTVRSKIFFPRDLVRFAAVCRPWRAAASRQPPQGVAALLLLSSYEESSHLCGPDDAWVIRAPSNARPVGSQDGGWVAFMDIDTHMLAIMNLFSGDQVMLSPAQSNITQLWSGIMPHVTKVIFSGDPSSSDGCILAAIVERRLFITLCKVGCQDSSSSSSRWITYVGEELMDIAFCNGELYGVMRATQGGLFMKFHIRMPEGDSTLAITTIERLDIQRPAWNDHTPAYARYIFELHGKLSMAARTRWLPGLDPFFKIFKLVDVDDDHEACKHRWAEVTSFGDYALFLGQTRSKAVHVAQSTEHHRGLERNQLYYTDEPTFSSINKLPNDTVYSLKSDDGDEIKMYCKKDQSNGDGMERTGYYRKALNYAVWVHPPDL